MNRRNIILLGLLLAVSVISFANTSMPQALAQVTSSSITTSITTFLTSSTVTSFSTSLMTFINRTTSTVSVTQSLGTDQWITTTMSSTSYAAATVTQDMVQTSTVTVPYVSANVQQNVFTSVSNVQTIYPDLSQWPTLAWILVLAVASVLLTVLAWGLIRYRPSYQQRLQQENQRYQQGYEQYKQQYYRQYSQQYPYGLLTQPMYSQSAPSYMQMGNAWYIWQNGQWHLTNPPR